jgi:flagellar hook-associated protein 2
VASPISFQGLSTGLQTDALINAILTQEGQPIARLQTQQALNQKRVTAFQAISRDLTSLSSSLNTLQNTSFDARTVTSSDANNVYVTATASGSAAGSYAVQVSQVATAARLGNTGGADTSFSVADAANTPIFSGASANFAIQAQDGTTKVINLGSGQNSLYGLRDAINASNAGTTGTGASVIATVVNTGSGANPYQLVLTSNTTGTGTTGGKITLADITNATNGAGGSAGAAVNSLGIQAGFVDSTSTPTSVTGGSASAGSFLGTDALFTVNGIQLTRKTNTVSDAVDGVTFTLKQGGQTGTTNLSVALDTGAITSGFQDLVSKFNAVVNDVSSNSGQGGALENDPAARNILFRLRNVLGSIPSGLPATNPFGTLAALGVKTNRDGTLSLDATQLTSALAQDPVAAKAVLGVSGASSNAVVSFIGASSATATGGIGFNVTSYTPGSGNVTAVLTAPDNTTYNVTGSGGILYGPAGTPLEGLQVSVVGTGSGTLNVSRGSGQALQDLISQITAPATGDLPQLISGINDQNFNLQRQITDGQARLDRRKTQLQAEYAQLETTVGQLQAAGQSLSGLR